jgi:starch synthase
MRVLMMASEVAPHAKTGGLADVMYALPRALARLGHQVDVVTPCYRGTAPPTATSVPLRVPLGDAARDVEALATTHAGVRVVLLRNAALFERASLYGEGGEDYPDNAERFAVLARGGLEWAALQREPYDVVHTHDWQTGLVPVFLRHLFASHPILGSAQTVHTIHNLAYQGSFDASWLPRIGLGWGVFRPDGLEFWGQVSYLKAAVMFSRRLTTVSRRYAQEIQTPEFGQGFDGVLRSRAGVLSGIVNGVDYDTWTPATDPHLPERFDLDSLDRKVVNKERLLAEFGLEGAAPRRPLIGLVSRLVEQKGFDLLAALEDALPTLDASFVVLGTGEARYEDMWRRLAARYPQRVAARIGFDEALAHRIEGGADLFLMPSRFEPCGLNQMYSSRYGTLPVVREVGGLADTVDNYDPATGLGTGFVFREYSAEALFKTLQWALSVYGQPDVWRRMQQAGMAKDFSWDASAAEYVKVYGADEA